MPVKNSYKGFAHIDKILVGSSKDKNLENAFHKYKVTKEWNKIAVAFIAEAANLTQAIDFKKGILTVACLTKEVASKLKILTQAIIKALNELLGRQLVYAIYIEV